MKRTWSTVGRCGAAAGILGLVLAGASSAGASPDDWWFGQSKAMIRGAAASQTSSGNYGLGVYARNNGAPEDAWGQFRFGEDANGDHGDAGEVHCLTRDGNGLMQVSGASSVAGAFTNLGVLQVTGSLLLSSGGENLGVTSIALVMYR